MSTLSTPKAPFLLYVIWGVVLLMAGCLLLPSVANTLLGYGGLSEVTASQFYRSIFITLLLSLGATALLFNATGQTTVFTVFFVALPTTIVGGHTLLDVNRFTHLAGTIEEVVPDSPYAARMRAALSSPTAFVQDKVSLNAMFPTDAKQALVGLAALERIMPLTATRAVPVIAEKVDEVRHTGVLTYDDRVVLAKALLDHQDVLAGLDVSTLSQRLLAQHEMSPR